MTSEIYFRMNKIHLRLGYFALCAFLHSKVCRCIWLNSSNYSNSRCGCYHGAILATRGACHDMAPVFRRNLLLISCEICTESTISTITSGHLKVPCGILISHFGIQNQNKFNRFRGIYNQNLILAVVILGGTVSILAGWKSWKLTMYRDIIVPVYSLDVKQKKDLLYI